MTNQQLSSKDLMDMVNGLACRVGAELEIVNQAPGADKRWVSISKTHLQQGFMALKRAIDNPTTF